MARHLFVVVVPIVALLSACAAHLPPPPHAVSQLPATKPSQAQSTSPSQAASTSSADACSPAAFSQWVVGFRQRAAAQGVAASTLQEAFANAQYLPTVVKLDNRQPEFVTPIWDYLDTAVSASRVANGRAKLAEYQNVADATTARYGVPGSIIVAIWGMESDYGADFGHFETIDALATLGCDGKRQAFAEKQLYAALKILAAGDISRADMQGSWAGAMGNPQFEPTSFLAYAVDANGGGKPDIWSSVPDTMASIAHYLAANGWQRGQPWGREVRLPAGFDYSEADGATLKSTQAWAAAGVQSIDARSLPDLAQAGVIAPAGASGPAFLVGHNFRVILRYNNATAYALAVALLSDQIDGEPGVQAPWPRDAKVLSISQTRTLQQQLDALGYSAGTPDGMMGPHTKSAVRTFQRAHGLIADGFATEALARQVAGAAR